MEHFEPPRQIDYGNSSLVASRKRPMPRDAPPAQGLADNVGLGMKRQRMEPPVAAETMVLRREDSPLLIEDFDTDVPTQKYADLPLTEAAQAKMLREIEELERFVLFIQQILRAFVNENPNLRPSYPSLMRDIEFILQSPTVIDVMESVVGVTGVGKSTLIAALFGMMNITQSSDLGKAVTTAVIIFGENKDDSCECKAVFEFITEEEFRNTIEKVFDDLADKETSSDAESSSLDMVMAYCGKSMLDLKAMISPQSVAGSQDESSRDSFTQQVLSNGPQSFLGQKADYPYETWQIMRDDVQQKISATQQNGGTQSNAGKWWPILSTVQLLIKHPLLKRGLKLTDTPGLGDANAARTNLALSAITRCNALVLTVPAVRANSMKEHLNSLKRAVARVHQEGRLHTIIVVCTQADQMDVEQTAADLNSRELLTMKTELTSAIERLQYLELHVPKNEKEYEAKKKLINDCKQEMRKWQKQLDNAVSGKRLTIPRNQAVEVNFSRPLGRVGIESALEQLKTKKEALEKRCRELVDGLPTIKSELEALTSKVDLLDHEYNCRTYQARNQHIADEQADLLIKIVKEAESNSVAAMKNVTQQTIASNLDNPKYWEKLREQLYPSMVAARPHLKLISGKGDADGAVKSREMTGIDNLALRLKAVNLVEQLAHISSVKTRAALVLNTLRDAASNRVVGSPLAGTALISQTMFLDRLNQLSQLFDGIVSTAKLAIDKAFRTEYLDCEVKLGQLSLAKAKQRMGLFGKPPRWKPDKTRDKGLRWNEYKAGCAPIRAGVWDGSTISYNFNDTVAAVLRMYTSGLFVGLFTAATNSSGSRKAITALVRCQNELVEIIDLRHREFARLAGEVQMNAQTLQYLSEQVRLRKCDIASIVRQAKSDMAEVHIKASALITQDVRMAYTNAYRTVHNYKGGGYRAKAVEELDQALSRDSVVKGPMQRLQERVQVNYSAVMASLKQQITDAAESMRQDYSQTLQKQEEGFLKIVNRKFATDLEHGLLALENCLVDTEEGERTDDEENEMPIKAEFDEEEDPLDYA